MILIVVSRILIPAPDVHGLITKTHENVKLGRFAGKMTCYQLTLTLNKDIACIIQVVPISSQVPSKVEQDSRRGELRR